MSRSMAPPGGAGARLDPAARGAVVRRAPAGGESSSARMRRALACFNSSPEGRKMRGLARSLGRPSVSVGAAARVPGQVRVTVVWDLCWYQWGVDPDDRTCPICELASGSEVDELDWAARQWNGHLARGGEIRLGRVHAP